MSRDAGWILLGGVFLALLVIAFFILLRAAGPMPPDLSDPVPGTPTIRILPTVPSAVPQATPTRTPNVPPEVLPTALSTATVTPTVTSTPEPTPTPVRTMTQKG